jgi:hypothetical protein
MELQLVLGARVRQGDGQVRAPVHGTSRAECEEHGLEECAPLIPAIELLRGHVQPSDLRAQPLDQVVGAAAIPERGDVLVEQRLAGSARVAALGVGHESPVPETRGFTRGDLIVPLMTEVSERDEQKRRRQEDGAVDADVAPQEVQRELHAGNRSLPGLLQPVDGQAAHRQEP